jgi:4,5-dihydroxyphthalate decarboxylase
MTTKLQLSLMMSVNDRSQPVLDGSVTPDGIDLVCTPGHPSEIFWRQLKFKEFDVSEMSLSSLIMAVANGNTDWVGLPIFTSRRFFHTGAWIRTDAGVQNPKNLEGKRVGVPEYQQTAALWARGIFNHEFGVDPRAIEWWMERPPERSHGGATGFRPPEGIRLNYIPPDQSIGSMLVQGKLDATLMYLTDRNLVDRSRTRIDNDPAFRTLFDDPVSEGRRYFDKTGIFPINHGMVVRRSIYERHPWVALNIFNAFRRAKDDAAARLRELASTHVELGMISSEPLSLDPYPYGVKSNQKVLQTIAEYSHEQGLTPRIVGLDEIFAPSTLDL